MTGALQEMRASKGWLARARSGSLFMQQDQGPLAALRMPAAINTPSNYEPGSCSMPSAHRSNRMPRMPGCCCSRAASTWPTPPPTSATVAAAQGDQSNSCSQGQQAVGFWAATAALCRGPPGSCRRVSMAQPGHTVPAVPAHAAAVGPRPHTGNPPAGWQACRLRWPPSWLGQSVSAARGAAGGREDRGPSGTAEGNLVASHNCALSLATDPGPATQQHCPAAAALHTMPGATTGSQPNHTCGRLSQLQKSRPRL